MVGVILAAGDGTRLNIKNGCKPLVKVNGVPLVEYSLNNLVELGISEAYIVVGRYCNLIRNALGDNYKGMRIFYVHQPEQKGLINAFVHALKYIDCGAVLQLSDEIFINMKYGKIKECITASNFDFYCGVTFENDTDKIRKNFSVECDEGYIIKNCVEKPEVIINNIKGTGFCVFGAEAVSILKDIYSEEENLPRELCDFMNLLTTKGKRGMALNVAEKELNINTSSDIEEAQCF